MSATPGPAIRRATRGRTPLLGATVATPGRARTLLGLKPRS
ncbi:hypothetical protein [Streptomyces sp. NPDC058773]